MPSKSLKSPPMTLWRIFPATNQRWTLGISTNERKEDMRNVLLRVLKIRSNKFIPVLKYLNN
jgi:hypothetical protein